MEKYCAKSKNLINLKKLYTKKQLFANILTTKVFDTILEIFKNAVGRFFTDCFSTKTRKKCKKYLKTLINNLNVWLPKTSYRNFGKTASKTVNNVYSTHKSSSFKRNTARG